MLVLLLVQCAYCGPLRQCKTLCGACWSWLVRRCVVWARTVAREHLSWRGPSCRAMRLHGVLHVLVGRRGGVGGERGRERGALHDPIVLTIVEATP